MDRINRYPLKLKNSETSENLENLSPIKKNKSKAKRKYDTDAIVHDFVINGLTLTKAARKH